MRELSQEIKFVDLARAYFSRSSEHCLSAETEIEREQFLSGIRTENVVGTHQRTFERIARKFPATPLNSAFNLTPPSLLELLKAYGMAFRENATRLDRSEEANDQNERTIRGILETVTEGVILFDEEAKVQLFNPTAETIFGRNANDVIGHDFFTLIGDACVSNVFSAAVGKDSEGPFVTPPTEVAGIKSDGTEFPIEVEITQMCLHEQNQNVCLVRSLTERNNIHR